MSFLTLEFAILFLKVLNIDFPLILISLNVVERSYSLNDFSNRWCKRKNVEADALKEWKINILKLLILVFHFTLVIHIFYPINPKSSFRHLKRGIRDFHMNYVLVPADKAAYNVVVV